jgi:hypothetical protein
MIYLNIELIAERSGFPIFTGRHGMVLENTLVQEYKNKKTDIRRWYGSNNGSLVTARESQVTDIHRCR